MEESGLGTWRTDVSRSDKLVEFSLASGLPKEFCTEEVLSQVRVTVSREGEVFTALTQIPGMPDKVIKYKLGEQFEMDTPRGKAKVTITEQDGKVTEKMVMALGITVTSTREMISPTEMKSTTTTPDGKTYTQIMMKV